VAAAAAPDGKSKTSALARKNFGPSPPLPPTPLQLAAGLGRLVLVRSLVFVPVGDAPGDRKFP